MAQATRTLPSLNNGISLQPPILRSADQTDDEINTWGVLAVGLSRRPPTKHVADLGIDGIEDAFVHHISRDQAEQYIVVITAGTVRVFDAFTGVEKTVTSPYGTSYLSGPSRAFRAVTVADYTFIVNSSTVVSMGALGDDTMAPPSYHPPGGAKAA